MLAMSPEFVLFINLQLPATILLGGVAGFVASRVLVIRRGRVSLRANAAVVLIAAVEAAVVARRPDPWMVLGLAFLVAATAAALADAGVILLLDRWRAAPRFSPRGRRVAMRAVAAGVVALLVASSFVVKHVIALNPAGASPWDGPVALGMALGPIAAVDLAARAVHQKVTGGRRPGPRGATPPAAP